jgi:hypothetical protein
MGRMVWCNNGYLTATWLVRRKIIIFSRMDISGHGFKQILSIHVFNQWLRDFIKDFIDTFTWED